MTKFIYNQKYEQDCSLVTTINAALYLGSIKNFDLDSDTELYQYYYNYSNGSLSPEKIEPYLKIRSERVEPSLSIIRKHLKKGLPVEMITYHPETGWHSLLLIPGLNKNKVRVIDPFVGELSEKEKKSYYDWNEEVNPKYFFDLAKTYPNKVLEAGAIRLFWKKD